MAASTLVDCTAFAVGCLLTVAGGVSVLSGRAPSWPRHVERTRLFGVWALCLGLFCVTQPPALRDEVTGLGAAAVDGRVALLLVSAAALLLGVRKPRGQ
ncbi:hypothetical protein ABTY98_09640 [Streptomyces sp. NPDC096040]|uniref:hypothetical protein n=1 Tax=Streptomyces sp. NPDC096040 TaxID=3155541 RepID=UPI00332BC0E7